MSERLRVIPDRYRPGYWAVVNELDIVVRFGPDREFMEQYARDESLRLQLAYSSMKAARLWSERQRRTLSDHL